MEWPESALTTTDEFCFSEEKILQLHKFRCSLIIICKKRLKIRNGRNENLNGQKRQTVVALEWCFLEIMENIYVSETYRYIASKRKKRYIALRELKALT